MCSLVHDVILIFPSLNYNPVSYAIVIEKVAPGRGESAASRARRRGGVVVVDRRRRSCPTSPPRRRRRRRRDLRLHLRLHRPFGFGEESRARVRPRAKLRRLD